MPRQLSTQAHIEARRTSGCEPFLEAVEIMVPVFAGQASRTVRLINDTDDLMIEGEQYTACPFNIRLPNDRDAEMPAASITFSGAHHELIKLIEATNGAENATIRLMVILRSVGVPEFDFTMEFFGIKANAVGVSGQLGFPDLMSRASLNQRYEQRTAAGLV